MFYSRPALPPLNLDLVEVGGGGSCPSQFTGRTADGREVYMRYRNGWFSVTLDDAEDPAVCAEIGPAFHGDMLLEQACDLAGITIRGQEQTLSEERFREANAERLVLDWSGRTTYWWCDVRIAKAGADRFGDALAKDLPDMRILEGVRGPSGRSYISRKAISDCDDNAVLGFGANRREIARLSGDHPRSWFGRLFRQRPKGSGQVVLTQVQIGDLDLAFAHHLRMRLRWNDRIAPKDAPVDPLPRVLSTSAQWSKKIGRDIQVPDFDLLCGLQTSFRTGDPAGERYGRALVAAFNACFSDWVEEVDLDTGEVVGGAKQMRHYSLDLRDWCRAAPNRFLSCFEDKEGRRLGIRPTQAPV